MKSKSITIKIKMDGEAFDNMMAHEVTRIIREKLQFFEDECLPIFQWDDVRLRDINGNTCGSVKLTGF